MVSAASAALTQSAPASRRGVSKRSIVWTFRTGIRAHVFFELFGGIWLEMMNEP